MKKLSGWARSRSRRRGSQGKDVEKRGSTENPASPNGTAVSSKTAPPVPQIPQEYRTGRTMDIGNARPGSSNKFKPMFVGVSRPSATLSRPGTSGSLQNAVTSAADMVAQSQPSDIHRGHGKANLPPKPVSPALHQGHTRTISPRYIDILSISNPKSTTKNYNEDIAERNLDTNIVAKGMRKPEYLPTSKYQEEVAARNAVTPLRPSMDQPRLSSSEGYRPNYAELRAHGAPQEYQVEGRLANDEDIRKLHEAEKSAQYEYRRRRQLLGEPGQLSERPEEKAPTRSQASDPIRYTSRNGVMHQSPPAYQQQQPVISSSGQRAELSLQQVEARHPLPASKPVHTGVIPAGTLPGYKISRSELSQPREADTMSMSQQSTSDLPGIPDRGTSPISTNSSVKRAIALSHRTIMDLTGNDSDVFSDGYPESYMSRSPIVEVAHQDSYSKAQPAVVDATSPVDHPSEFMAASTDPHVTYQYLNGISQANHVPETIMQYRPPSTFSGINTIASVVPQAKEDVKRKAIPNVKALPLAKDTRKATSSTLYTVAETEPELEEYESIPRATRTASLSSHLPTDNDTSSFDGHPAPVVDRHDFATGEKGLVQKSTVPPSPATSMRSQAQSDVAQSTPNGIQMSPESLQSADFINPSSSFGVRTRDFAVTPSRSTASHSVPPRRTDREPNTSAKVASGLRSKSVDVANREFVRPTEPADPTIAKYSSGFNEDEFRQKQELARAALIKLQQSLNEDLVTPTRETKKVQPRTNGVRRHANSNSSIDGRPYAPPPTSIFTQVRDYHRPATSQANGYSEARDTSRPRTAMSVHEQVTNGRPISPASTTTIKPNRRQLSPDPEPTSRTKRNSKGKEKELNNHLSEMQRLAYEMGNTKLAMPNPAQQRVYEDAASPLPRSPGEISLSSFPVPTPSHSRQTSLISNNMAGPSHHHSSSNYSSFSRAAAAPSPVVSPIPASPDLQNRPYLARRGSTKSQTSVMTSTSQHSIPFHLIPDRGSSMRDSLVREVDSEA